MLTDDRRRRSLGGALGNQEQCRQFHPLDNGDMDAIEPSAGQLTDFFHPGVDRRRSFRPTTEGRQQALTQVFGAGKIASQRSSLQRNRSCKVLLLFADAAAKVGFPLFITGAPPCGQGSRRAIER